jgi:hypothetical protein
MLPVAQRYVNRGDTCNEKMSFNPSSGKAEIEPKQFKKIQAVYFWRYTLYY